MSEPDAEQEPQGGDIVRRHALPVRLWHWFNALAVIVMLMSGLMIFNAHPHLYWGKYGANFDHSWLDIGAGHLRIGPLTIPVPPPIGVVLHGRLFAFSPSITLPAHYDLAGARQWHFAFAWVLVLPGLLYGVWSLVRGHLRRDLLPRRGELSLRHIWHDIRQHARLRFLAGAAARRYNILQKLAYLAVLILLLPGVVLSGLCMSPTFNAAAPWLLALMGGRSSSRSIHFICAMGLAFFILIHILMVILAGPINEVRSMITGRYRLPPDRLREPAE